MGTSGKSMPACGLFNGIFFFVENRTDSESGNSGGEIRETKRHPGICGLRKKKRLRAAGVFLARSIPLIAAYRSGCAA
ncbi:hypothetical protein HBF32_11235 [Luteibacter yeojuensis]|uniref:Uncharacterized protein n=1 Tax=Luteibacter yeojuensis TaxID=345309 RepID=A0A7X5QVE7_9GAMM|nr:hypothetical protein [Luteibacter yeojuensis]